jgi:putative nucleotidyltransferase with HDIG domain
MKLKLILEGIVEKVAVEFISNLVKNSQWKGKVYLAGGYVRDEILGLDPKDIDIVVEFPEGGIKFAEWVTKELGIYKSGSNPVIYPKYGTAKFNLRHVSYKGYDLSEIDIECVMTRKEQYNSDSRNPTVDYGTIQQDVERRDLTVNSLLKDLTTGEILDLTGYGLSDIKNGIIRTPIYPEEIFKDDPLRMLRAIRFTVKYNWNLPMFMIRAMKDNAYRLKIISPERIKDELNKMLVTMKPATAIRLLQITGLSKYVFPELDLLIKLKQNKYHQYDAMKHTLMVLSKTPPVLITRLSALFHDIAKPQTKSIIDNEIHFYKHEEISAQMAGDLMKRLKYPNSIIDPVVFAIDNHMRTKPFGKETELVSDKSLRKLQADLGDHLENVLDLIDADNNSHSPEHNLTNQVQNIRTKLNTLNSTSPAKQVTLPITGNDVIKLTGFKPGKIIGDILDYVTDKWYDNPNMTKANAEELVLQYMVKLDKI